MMRSKFVLVLAMALSIAVPVGVGVAMATASSNGLTADQGNQLTDDVNALITLNNKAAFPPPTRAQGEAEAAKALAISGEIAAWQASYAGKDARFDRAAGDARLFASAFAYASTHPSSPLAGPRYETARKALTRATEAVNKEVGNRNG